MQEHVRAHDYVIASAVTSIRYVEYDRVSAYRLALALARDRAWEEWQVAVRDPDRKVLRVWKP